MKIIDGNARLPARAGIPAAHRLLRLMDELGIAAAVVAGGGYISPEQLARHVVFGGGLDVDIDHGLLLEQCATAPERLLPVYIGNPHRGDAGYRERGRAFHALKLAPVLHGVALEDARNLALVAHADDLGHPVYLHCLHRPGFGADDLVALARRFPQTRFVLEHAGVGNCDFHALSVIAPVPNVSLETSGGFTLVVQAACERLGARRVLFGSEYPMQHPRAELTKMRCLELDDAALARILGQNAAELLGLENIDADA
jgi:predicted TIM-barrel fold metal-dependent hydrolase